MCTLYPLCSTYIVPYFQVQHLYQQQEVCCNVMFVFDPDTSLSPGRHIITTHTQLSWDDHPVTGTRYTNHWKTLSHGIEVPGQDLRLSTDIRSTFTLYEKNAVNISDFFNLLKVALMNWV